MKNPKSKKSNLKKLKILIVDDHVMYRKGMFAMLSNYPFIAQLDQAENGLMAIEALKRTFYDIVFLDIEMPVMNGIEVAKIMKKDFRDSKIIVMTALDKKSYVYQFLEIGVSAYLLKGFSEKEMIQAFELVMDGGNYITVEINEMYQEYLKEKSKLTYRNFNEVELSKTEKRVVEMMCQQLTSDQIAIKLGMRKSTVDTHRKHIFKKLKIINSIGIAIYAVKTGLFKLWEDK